MNYQDYASDAEELADLLADNRLSELAELDEDDLKRVIESIRASDPSFDVELTGFMEDEIARLYDEKPEDDVENPATKQRDQEMRQLLESEGYEVFSISYTRLFDQAAIAAFLKRVAKSLIGKDAATRVTQGTAWFEAARAVELRQKANG